MSRPTDLARLLAELDAEADLPHRHLWLIHLLEWVRGDRDSVPGATARLQLFLDAVEARPELRARLQAWWAQLVDTVDITTLLADFGFAPRTAFVSELAARLRTKWLPGTPDTIDASELFVLAVPHEFDAQWMAALDEAQLNRLAALLVPPGEESGLSLWRHALLNAITYCAGQILSTGFAPELRLRMSEEAREAQPFHALIRDVESLRVEVLHALRTPDRLNEAAQRLRERLEACRAATATVYTHFEDNGISVGLVFRLRQLRERIVRVRLLLDCLLSPKPALAAAKLMSSLVQVGQERRSLRALFASNSSLVAAKVAERSAETGEHYITRTRGEYREMLRSAAGGGAVMAVTTFVKFLMLALGLPPFWTGMAAGLNYATSFVVVQWLHFTVATKQPAMTAPAMAAKLEDTRSEAGVEGFVDEVAHLIRSQMAGILGNLMVVAPLVIAVQLLAWWALGAPLITEEKAHYVLESMTLLGPTLWYAAFTGVLLFSSSIIAGWVENWFVLHRLDSALRWNPRIRARLGAHRAARWSVWWRENISGLAANISLGFMLGVVPVVASFLALPLDIRHVTLSAGQTAAAAVALGWDVVHNPQLWWCVAAVPLTGVLNVGVSFAMALRVAVRSRGVRLGDRARLWQAIRRRMWRQPLSFLLPPRSSS